MAPIVSTIIDLSCNCWDPVDHYGSVVAFLVHLAELLLSAGVGDLQDIVATRRRRFIGHVLRLPTSRPASLVIDWTPEGGCKRWGRPKRTWRDTFMEDMRAMGVSGSGTHDEIRSVARDRARWRQLVAQCPSRDRRT